MSLSSSSKFTYVVGCVRIPFLRLNNVVYIYNMPHIPSIHPLMSFSFYLCENVFILPIFLNDVFTGSEFYIGIDVIVFIEVTFLCL